MKSRCEIWLQALNELGAMCSVDTTRDAVSVVRRVENEGEFFFTKTLPSFAKDLERSLAEGQIPSWLFSTWGRRNLTVHVLYEDAGSKIKKWSHRGAPKFLGGFMDIIFNSTTEMSDRDYQTYVESGGPVPLLRVTSDEAEVARMASAIFAIRQLCLMFSKEQDLCSQELIDKAVEKYVLLDEGLIHPF